MRMKNKYSNTIMLTVATLGSLSLASFAKLSTAQVFSNNMVLQRGLAAPVWGWDNPGTEVTVNFSGQTKKTTTNKKGRWEIKLDPLTANANGQSMTITGTAGDTISYNDVLIGDVWICSGQSNMEWYVTQCHNPQQEVANANHPHLRIFDVTGHTIAASPQEKLAMPSTWNKVTPQTIGKFSACGYYFGREIQQQSGVPIGLLGTNWGGTRIEPWTPPAGFRSQPKLAYLANQIDAQLANTPTGKVAWLNYAQQLEEWTKAVKNNINTGDNIPRAPKSPGPKTHHEACSIFNSMVAPVVGYGVRGAIWYQGESNSGEGIHYLPKLKALVQGWREIWNQPADFPLYFYVVKLAQFNPHTTTPEGGEGFARLRAAQDRIQELPHTGVASAIDIGHASDIHPKNKQDIGKRLARWAMRDVYGKKDIVVAGPTFKEMKIEGNTVTIHYDHVGSGLQVAKRADAFTPPAAIPNGKLASFAICGADRKWHWADAVIKGNTVTLSSPNVSTPTQARYAYRGNPMNANLFNKEGLPAIPFRTDEFHP